MNLDWVNVTHKSLEDTQNYEPSTPISPREFDENQKNNNKSNQRFSYVPHNPPVKRRNMNRSSSAILHQSQPNSPPTTPRPNSDSYGESFYI